jgi:hypothetical protein
MNPREDTLRAELLALRFGDRKTVRARCGSRFMVFRYRSGWTALNQSSSDRHGINRALIGYQFAGEWLLIDFLLGNLDDVRPFMLFGDVG